MKAKKRKRPGPRMPLASEEMKRWSAMLGQELSALPQVKSRPMFGLRGFYRGKRIFAALPVTRAVKTSHSLIFRITPMPPDLLKRAVEDSRIDTESEIPSARWYAFEVSSEEDLRDALWWLNQAYERAR